MTGRWCEQHRRRECASQRSYPATGPCHGTALRGKQTCLHHDRERPAVGYREAARRQVQFAVADGILQPPDDCEMCGRGLPDTYIEGHHEEYSRPLDVIWLCATCHGRVHKHHRGLVDYIGWLRAQLAAAERIHDRFYAAAADVQGK